MKPRSLLLVLPLLLLTALSRAADRPNVVIFLADDAGWGDYSRNGNTQVRTPNIDSIARGGATLDRFYVSPVCSPTRAEFLTGRYHPRMGVYGTSAGQERMSLEEKTVAESFKAAGYATGAFGKWHNGSQWPYHPRARGFDDYYGYTSGHWGEYFDPLLERDGKFERAKGYIVDVLTDAAISFIEKNRARPFLCYVPFTTPHSPWGVPASDWARFKDMPISQQSTVPGLETPDETRCALAMMENQDANVGRVLAKLDALGLAENTIVIYFTDNGPNTWRWNGGMKGKKGGTDEGSVRSPFFIRWPTRIPQDRTLPEISGAIDLLPTLTGLAGIPSVGTKPLDGRDLSARLLGKAAEPGPDRMIFTTINQNVSVRTQRYRLDAQGGLFDMVADPAQTKAVNEAQPEEATRLKAAVASWREEVFSPDSPLRQRAKAKAKGDGKTKAAGGGNAVDPRPIPVGYREFPITWLPARDGEPRGAVRRSSNAPNSSYFVNWTTPADTLTWEVDVHEAGNYAVDLEYTCALPDAGSTIELSLNGQRLTGKVAPEWDPPLYTNQDTLPRPPAESKLKEFRKLNLGTLRLAAGRGPLTLRALEIPGKEVIHLSSVTLTLLP